MAAKRRYATVPEQMVFLAQEARREGLSFEDWWDRALRPGRPPILVTMKQPWPTGCVVWPSDSWDRNGWRDATLQIKEGWRRAYNQDPATPQENAIRILEPILTARALSAPLPSGMELAAA